MTSSSSNYASVVISDCLKVKPGEEVLIFTDKNKLQFAEDLAGPVKEAGAKASVFYIPESIRPVERINDVHAISLMSADAVIYVLETESKDVARSREVAFRHYLIVLPIQYKGRVCMMPGFTEEMKAAVLIDYSKLKERCKSLDKLLSDKSIRITSDLGTDIKFSLQGRKFLLDDGDLSKQGAHGNVPAGEIYTAPVEDTMNGRLVIDGSVGSLGMVKYPFAIEVVGGLIKKIGPIDEQIKNERNEIMDKFIEISEFDAPATKTIGEFGIGLNPGAKLIGNMLIDEKVKGTIHFAFGDSYGLGRSSSKFHTDLLITNPSIFVEGKCIMDHGKFIVDMI